MREGKENEMLIQQVWDEPLTGVPLGTFPHLDIRPEIPNLFPAFFPPNHNTMLCTIRNQRRFNQYA